MGFPGDMVRGQNRKFFTPICLCNRFFSPSERFSNSESLHSWASQNFQPSKNLSEKIKLQEERFIFSSGFKSFSLQSLFSSSWAFGRKEHCIWKQVKEQIHCEGEILTVNLIRPRGTQDLSKAHPSPLGTSLRCFQERFKRVGLLGIQGGKKHRPIGWKLI